MNFSDLSDEVIIKFIDANFDCFSKRGKPKDFPENLIQPLCKGELFTVKVPEGFALIRKGDYIHEIMKYFPVDKGPENPGELMFIYVNPRHRHKGIARLIIEKALAQSNFGLELRCDGAERRERFKELGFQTIAADDDVYLMHTESSK